MFGTSNAGYDAAKTAGGVGAGYGAGAAGIKSNLIPFLTRRLTAPEGYSQADKGAMLSSAEAGAGGSTAGLTTEANLAAARNRNSGSFSGSLDQAAREKDKALAGVSEGIASKDADLKQQQQTDASKQLGDMAGMDQSAQLKAMGLVPEDLNAQNGLNKSSGWASQIGDIIGDASGLAKFGGDMGIPIFNGFKTGK